MGVRETLTFDHIKRGYTSIKMLSPASCPQVRNSLRSRERLGCERRTSELLGDQAYWAEACRRGKAAKCPKAPLRGSHDA